MSYSTAKGVLNTRTKQHPGGTLAGLREQHGEPRVLDTTASRYHGASKKERGDIKKALDYFVGGAIKGRRHDDNVVSRTMITLDIEAREGQAQPPSPEDTFDTMERLGAEGWVYTSIGHTPDAPRYRVVLPLGKPLEGADLTASVLEATTKAAAKKLGLGPWCTPESYVLSQPMYLPAKLKDSVFWEAFSSGKGWAIRRPDGVAEGSTKADALDALEGPRDPVLHALRAAGHYIGEAPRHPGMHYITCPWADQHSTESDSKTAYYEAHHDGNPRPACKCMSTSHEELTYPKLVQWLRNEGHLTKAEAAPEVMEDADAWAARTGAGSLLGRKLTPIQEVWEKLALVGEVTAIVGPGGVSKSAFALRLAYEGANGRGMGNIRLQDFPVVQSTYISFEDGEAQVQKRLKRMTEAEGAGLDTMLHDLDRALHIDCITVANQRGWKLMMLDPQTKTPIRTERVDWLVKSIKKRGDKALIIDTGIRSHELDEMSPAHMNEFVMTLHYIAQEAECAVLVLLHATKFAQVAELEDVNQTLLRGSSATADAARSAVVLLSLRQRWAPRFNLPATKETTDRFFVLFHVKHNHTAPLPIMVFERDGPVVLPRPDIKLLSLEEAAEKRDEVKQSKADADTHARAAAVLLYLQSCNVPATETALRKVRAMRSSDLVRTRVLAFLTDEALVTVDDDWLPSNTKRTTLGYSLNTDGSEWLATFLKTNKPWDGRSKS